MDFEDVIFEKSNHIATVTLNNPEKLNALTGKMLPELSEALDIVRNDDDIRVMILTGAGRGFCTGADVEMLLAIARGERVPGAPEAGRREDLLPVGWFGVEVSQVEKPTIAAVNGPAVGGGFAIAMACDMRIISDRAIFGFMSTQRYALPPEGGVTYLLPRIIGLAKTCELLFTGAILDAPEAERMGLVNRMVPHDQVMEASMELAAKIAANGPLAMEVTKHLIYRGLEEKGIGPQVEREGPAVLRGLRTEDFREGALARWHEHREPVFVGR